ncbi:MAG: glycosyltransferase family 39 protein, partial [Acidobacteriota bacterium]
MPPSNPTGPQKLCLVLILIGLAAALVFQAWQTGVSVDGPAHLLSSHLYWHGADRLGPRDLPPLIKIAGGWVPALLGLPIPYDHPAWRQQHEWTISQVMMERMRGSQIQRLFFYSRLPLLIFPLLTAWLLWRWGRELFGGWVAVLLALAYALEPTALAHGALYKNDLAATFGYLLFWYAAWKFWRDPRPLRAAGLGAALLVAILAKLSMLFLVAVAPVLVLLRYLTRRPVDLRRASLALVLMLLIPYLGALAACQFEARTLSAGEVEKYARDNSVPRSAVLAAQVFRIVPAPLPMWQGALSLISADTGGNAVYMLGQVYPRGHPLYFLFGLAVKAPLALHILGACGLALLAVRLGRRHLQWSDTFWLLPGALYIGLASLSTLQLGIRLILPALP